MAKKKKMSVIELMLNRDEILKVDLRASLSRFEAVPDLIDQALEEAFQKAQERYLQCLSIHNRKLLNRLDRKIDVTP